MKRPSPYQPEKCIQCGLCCLSSPCWEVPIGEEVYKDGIHICPNQSFKNGLSFCSLYNKVRNGGQTCTSNRKSEYKLNPKLLKFKEELVKKSFFSP